VDEAHASARPRGTASGVEHQRYELLRDLARDPSRQILLVTVTPHSGIEESFRSLLGLLDGGLDLDPAQPLDREALVPYIVQRRRRDVEKWLGSETPFPDRKAEEDRYELSRAYQALFSDVLEYCRESIEDSRGLRAAQQRVRHWAAIAILRSALSSPDAAAMVLGNRISKLSGDGNGQEESESTAEIDDAYRPQVLDLFGDEELADYAPTGPVHQAERIGIDYDRRRLKLLGDRARALAGPKEDRKLARLVEIVRDLLQSTYRARHSRLLRAAPSRWSGNVSGVGITVEGGLLAGHLVERITAGDDTVKGQQAKDFDIEAGRLSAEIQAAFSDIRVFWDAFKRRREHARTSAVTLTREGWVIPSPREQ
jgi:hypothetical protein